MNNVLLVDDEPHILTFLKIVLEQNNLKVIPTESAESALEILEKQQVDCIVCDIFLSGISGLECIKQIRKMGITTPVILITGQPDVETAQVAVKHKAYDYLTKPIQSSDLVKSVKNAINQYRLEKESKILEEKQKKYQEKLEKNVKRRIRELKETESKYKTILEQTLIGLYVIQNNKIKYANNKFLELFEFSNASELANFNMKDFVIDQEKDMIEKKMNELLKEKIDNVHYTFSAKTLKHNHIEIEVWENKIIFDSKQAIQGIVIDNTDKQNLFKREKEYEIRLMQEHKLAAIGQIATGIAHNLNTPISVILGNSELLKFKYPDTPEVEKIIRQAEKLGSIVQGLLTKSKMEQNNRIQIIDLNVLISSELEFFRSNMEFKHNIEKKYKFADNLPEIKGIYSDFSQSIMNLLQNAIDAMYYSNKKILTVQTSFNKDYILIKIADTGVGIDESDTDKLFNPFYTTKPAVDEIRGNEPTGIGLGLSTVYNLLTPYGIKIDFKSKVNSGTKVELKIPYKNLNKY